jgi:hypothetical protein
MVSAHQWRQLLGRARISGVFAGVSPRRYPADPRTFFGFQRALRGLPDRCPLPPPLSLDVVTEFVHQHASRYPGVRLEAG